MTTVDYKKNVPVLGSYEVVVAGAGPAGICAAVAAARSGARVALVERYGVLGGNLTAGYVGPILGMVGSGTMRDELMALSLIHISEPTRLGMISYGVFCLEKKKKKKKQSER